MKPFAILLFATLSSWAAVRFDRTTHIIDLRQHDWQYRIASPGESPAAASAARDWRRIRVGWRWDEMGFPGLHHQPVWLRLTFEAPSGLRGERFGLFLTEVDDEADIYLNGRLLTTARYELGYAVPGPTVVDWTDAMRWDGPNEVLLQLRDKYVRSPGLIGNVCLYRTLPFKRTANGGIETEEAGGFSVVLHLGAALLSQGGRTSFSAAELRGLNLPPYILREDELVLLASADEVAPAPPHRVELDVVHPTRASAPLAVSSPPLPETVVRYGQLALPLEVRATYQNPFDPRDVKVMAVVLSPSGRVDKIPAFFHQEFQPVSLTGEEEILLPAKGPAWKVYYRPSELGEYSVEIFAQDRTGVKKHAAGKFRSIPGQAPGFLRVSRRDPRFFEYDNGDSFFAIGPSGWFRGRNYVFGGNPRWVPVSLMDAFYERKAANRSNYEYLGTFHYGRLLMRGGFIDQHTAWKLEHTLRTMERLGIRWLFFHDNIRRYYRYGLDAVPYAASQGGPVSSFHEIYTNETSLDWQKNELQHIVARMADSPSIWMWNIGDEWRDQPGNKLSVPMVRSWMKELHAFVRSIDAYGHPHAIGEGEEAILNGGDVLPVEGWYLNHPAHPQNNWRLGRKYDLAAHVEQQLEKYRDARFPLVDVEGGLYGWNGGIYQSGKPYGHPEALTFHQHLWLSLFLKSAAGGTEWLINVLDNDGQMFHAKAFAQYLDGIELTKRRWDRAPATASKPGLSAWALQSEGATLAWVLNRSYNWLDLVEGRKGAPIGGAELTVPVAQPGSYRVEFWNTLTGAKERTVNAIATGTSVRLPLGEVAMDAALKLYKEN